MLNDEQAGWKECCVVLNANNNEDEWIYIFCSANLNNEVEDFSPPEDEP